MAKKTVNTAPSQDAMGVAVAPPKHSEWRRFARVFFGRKLYLIGFIIVVILIFTAIFAPLIARYDPVTNDLPNKLQGPSTEHWLGTDQLGRDIYSRIVWGTQISMEIGFAAVFSSAIVGILMGLAAAYFGGIVFAIIMRVTDALMALPGIILVLLIAGLGGRGIGVVIFALAFGNIAGMARMMCGQALSVKQNDYVMAARSIGMSNWRIMWAQIFPNAFPPLIVGLTMGIGGVVLGEAGLSYLGIGVPAPAPSWGGMVMDGQGYLLQNPIISLAPGVAIMLLVFGFNMVGDGIRDAIDPRLRGVL
ncbi:MAG: ABC transporter permease [Dehalococcoidales bacterium]|nr:ABC transporter permease [Dehalococcoidales bacterium]